MKLIYRKISQLKIFGFKLFEFKTDYIERSNDKDNDEDDFFISFRGRELQD